MDLVKAVVRSWGFYSLVDTGDETFFFKPLFYLLYFIFLKTSFLRV